MTLYFLHHSRSAHRGPPASTHKTTVEISNHLELSKDALLPVPHSSQDPAGAHMEDQTDAHTLIRLLSF